MRVTLADLIAMARQWPAHDIPLLVLIGGEEVELKYRYCGMDGVHFEVVA